MVVKSVCGYAWGHNKGSKALTIGGDDGEVCVMNERTRERGEMGLCCAKPPR